MYNITKLKILVIDPQASGKTNSQKQNVLQCPYRPTSGVRIVEHETYVDNRRVSIQFWDVSGSTKNERIWPAIQKQAQGVIIIFNGDNPKSETQADFWLQKFPKALSIPINQCVAFSHHVSGALREKKQRTLKSATTMKVAQTCREESSSTIHPAFNTFMSSLIEFLIQKQNKEENNLIISWEINDCLYDIKISLYYQINLVINILFSVMLVFYLIYIYLIINS